MSLRLSPPTPPPRVESDLDTTAELPVLDPAAAVAADATHSGSDTWILPPAARAALASAAAATAAPSEPTAGAEELQRLGANLQAVSAKLQEAEQLLASKLERVAQLERARDEAQAAHVAAEARVSALGAELAQREAQATRQAAQLDESKRALIAAEQRAAATAEELAQARELVSASSERAAQLQRRLDDHESASRTQRLHELVQQRSLTAQGRAHGARLAQDLQLERARAASYYESLQTLERRRHIAEELVTDLQQAAEARDAELALLNGELAGRDARTRELEKELAQHTAHTGRLEQQVSSFSARLEQRDAQLRDSRREEQALQTSIARLQEEVTAAASRTTSQEGALAAAHERGAQLEAALAAERQRAAQLEQELTQVRAEMEEWGGALKKAQQERNAQLDGISATSARVRQLEAELQAAEESARRLEAEARYRSARLGELATAAEAQHVSTDNAANAELHEAAQHVAAAAAPLPEPLLDGAARLLIRSEGEREIVHVLGRKTSIGRTPDNDVQIEAKYISRHHAVILVGPLRTIIEDLNSTNGVLVNGQRITHQILKDGDQVTIGRALYRFAVRRGDKR